MCFLDAASGCGCLKVFKEDLEAELASMRKTWVKD